jgi:hypothetical protein
MAQAWGSGTVAAKGAPEAVARLCRLDAAALAGMEAAAGAMAAKGLRVLALAECALPKGPLPDALNALPLEFRALVGIADPLRADVPDAVRACQAAGVRVMMITGDYPETAHAIAAQAGIEIKVANEDDVDLAKADNPILNEINLARIRGVDLREHYNQCGLDIEWHHFEFVERSYRHYKRSKELLDFTDLLEMIVVQPERLPSLEVLIVDEAQDLSRLQWQLVESLAKKSKRVFLAGDDDQAVFTWAGADVKSFLSFEGQITVLDQSYRVPSIVHKLANKVVEQIKERQEKEWKPRDYEGAVMTYYRFEDVPIDDGQWLIMGSTNYLLNPIHEWLRASGILFERSGVPSLSLTLLKAVQAWERLRKGEFLYGDEIRNVYK